MILTTTENIPGKKYEIISVVTSNPTFGLLNKDKMKESLLDMEKEGRKINADAIVGIKTISSWGGGTSTMGTAVRFI